MCSCAYAYLWRRSEGQLLMPEEVHPGELEPQGGYREIAEQVLDLVHEMVRLQNHANQSATRDEAVDEERTAGKLARRIVRVVRVELAPPGQYRKEDGRT